MNYNFDDFYSAYNKAVVRLRLAKQVMAARPKYDPITNAEKMRVYTLKRLLKAPKLTNSEMAFLNKPGAFQKGSPQALMVRLATSLLETTAELQAIEMPEKKAKRTSRAVSRRDRLIGKTRNKRKCLG